MQQNTQKLDSCQDVQSPLLTSIGNQLNAHLVGTAWDYVHIDGFISPDRSFRYIASYAPKEELRMHTFRFPYQQHGEIQETFLTLYDLGLSTPSSMWNKARFIYHNDVSQHLFEFYCDPDYQWFESLDKESREYAKLSIDDELAIQSWEGLPANHHRPWHKKTKLKSKQKTRASIDPIQKRL